MIHHSTAPCAFATKGCGVTAEVADSPSAGRGTVGAWKWRSTISSGCVFGTHSFQRDQAFAQDFFFVVVAATLLDIFPYFGRGQLSPPNCSHNCWRQLIQRRKLIGVARLLFTNYSYYQTIVLNNYSCYLLLHVTLQRSIAISAGCCPGPPTVPQETLGGHLGGRRSAAAPARGR